MVWDLDQINKIVTDELSAVTFLQKFRLIPSNMVCQNGHQMTLCRRLPVKWRCMKRSCNQNNHIKGNTWFYHSKIPLVKLIKFIYMWTTRTSSFKNCKLELGLGPKCITQWSQALREVCFFKMQTFSGSIGGEGKYVEIDVSLYTKQKNKADKIYPQQLIFGGICRETKEYFIVPVPDQEADTLLTIVAKRIKPGSIIVSDCSATYRDIQSLGHEQLIHTYNFVDSITLVDTQEIKRLWGSVKWDSMKRKGTAKQYLESYLVEFMWREKFKGKDLFVQILEDIAYFHENYVAQ